MSRRWVIADLHFNHTNVKIMTNAFETVEERRNQRGITRLKRRCLAFLSRVYFMRQTSDIRF